jgi:hypothetical protein
MGQYEANKTITIQKKYAKDYVTQPFKKPLYAIQMLRKSPLAQCVQAGNGHH